LGVHVETFSVGPLGCNCSIVADLEEKRAVVVDPGGDYARVKARLEALDLKVDAIIHTHTHIDHVGCTAELQRDSGATAAIHEADRFLYRLLPVQAALIGTAIPKSAEMEDFLFDGQVVRAGAIELAVLHTPGHTPGSCSFVVSHGGSTHVFAGDTLFRGSIGRTDLWGGDHSAILRSIQGRLLTLPDDAIVVAGHGPSTTIGEERAGNPFLRKR
jgi:glyoxylase-like metal-dependent hydrolase (beta-lactamase superfamily II)